MSRREIPLYYYGFWHEDRVRAARDMGLRELPGVPVPACPCHVCRAPKKPDVVLEVYEALQGEPDDVCEIAGTLFKDGWDGTTEELVATSRALAGK